jgi:hypothetical protein
MGAVTSLWNSKLGLLVRAAFEIYGMAKTLAALGASAVLSVIFSAIVEQLVSLSLFEKFVLIVGIFFVALAGVFGVVNRVLRQRASIKAELPFPTPTPPPLDWRSRQTLFNHSFRLTDLISPEQTMKETAVKDKTFYKCTIHGPAILFPGRQTRFTGKSDFFDEPRSDGQEGMWYEVQPGRTWFTGLVGTVECVFRDCTFVDVGFMAAPQELQKLRDHVAGEGDAELYM